MTRVNREEVIMKLIAIDLDGTLLNSESVPSLNNLEAIKNTLSGNHIVVICTGRASYDVAYLLGKEVKIPIIGVNGSTIHDHNGELLYKVCLDKFTCKKIIDYFQENDMYFEIFTNEAIYSTYDGEGKLKAEMDIIKSENPNLDKNDLWKSAIQQIKQFGIKPTRNMNEILEREIDVYKIMTFTYNEELLEKTRRYFSLEEKVSLTAASQRTVELIPKVANKGAAVKFLSRHYNISLDDVIVIGDSYNDISMFSVGGTKVAMGNAIDEIKKMSSIITNDNDQDGVAYALNNLLGI
mgnify:CR=1 FL=1